jgi:hypothetical protein
MSLPTGICFVCFSVLYTALSWLSWLCILSLLYNTNIHTHGGTRTRNPRIRSPDRPACSELLYRLRYPGPSEVLIPSTNSFHVKTKVCSYRPVRECNRMYLIGTTASEKVWFSSTNKQKSEGKLQTATDTYIYPSSCLSFLLVCCFTKLTVPNIT